MYPGECTKDLLHKGQVERLHASSAINSVVHKTCGTLTCNVTGDFKFKIHPVACLLPASYGLLWVVMAIFSKKEKAN